MLFLPNEKGVVKLVLFVDACTRPESRTRRLARELLTNLPGEVITESLSQLPVLDDRQLLWRNRCCETSDFSDEYFRFARRFAAADIVVIAAPFWDLSFPAILKQYLENICIAGLTFRYSPRGIPEGLCRAKQLYYVTTAGGTIYDDTFGFGYVRALSQQLFGIRDCRCLKAENLDIEGNDAEVILRDAASRIKDIIK